MPIKISCNMHHLQVFIERNCAQGLIICYILETQSVIRHSDLSERIFPIVIIFQSMYEIVCASFLH